MDGKVIYRYNIAKVLFKVSQKASLSLISTSTFREANCFKKVLHLKKKKKKIIGSQWKLFLYIATDSAVNHVDISK